MSPEREILAVVAALLEHCEQEQKMWLLRVLCDDIRLLGLHPGDEECSLCNVVDKARELLRRYENEVPTKAADS
jgi:hypothetical protein